MMVEPGRILGLIPAVDGPPLDLDRLAVALNGLLELAGLLVDRADAVQEDRQRIALLGASDDAGWLPTAPAGPGPNPVSLRQITSAARYDCSAAGGSPAWRCTSPIAWWHRATSAWRRESSLPGRPVRRERISRAFR